MSSLGRKDEHKIAIITCVNDRRMYDEAVLYLEQLTVPEGMELELVSVEEACSMASGYNEAMYSTDARYKVYIHQDVLLIRRSILDDIIRLFASDASIGMIGLLGAEKLVNACWWEGSLQCGAIINKETPESYKYCVAHIAKDDSMDVQAIDGAFMATQYDLPWREDLFKGWHFYDTSQSLEFNQHGYRTVVPRQEEPWFIHCNGRKFPGRDYEDALNVFVENYRW